MKKQLRTILAALAISSMMATTAFGAEMVYLNDYEGWEPNDSITAANQVSVTSVTKTDSTTFPNLGTTYYCAAACHHHCRRQSAGIPGSGSHPERLHFYGRRHSDAQWLH